MKGASCVCLIVLFLYPCFKPYRSVLGTIRTVVREEGFLGLYKGENFLLLGQHFQRFLDLFSIVIIIMIVSIIIIIIFVRFILITSFYDNNIIIVDLIIFFNRCGNCPDCDHPSRCTHVYRL